MELNSIYNNMNKKNENNINKKENEQNDSYEEYEEEEVNSDDYISSSMLDVDTNTYIYQTINNSDMNIIKENELKIKKKSKGNEKNIINLYSNKANNKLINKDEKDINILAFNQNSMIPLQKFLNNNNNKKKKIIYKINNNINLNKDINKIISFNSNTNKNKTYQSNDNQIKKKNINNNIL